MAKKPVHRPIPVKTSMLSAEDKAALREEAKKSVLAEMEQDARDAYFAEQLAAVRRSHVPDDEILNVAIDVAPFIQFIMIDGTQFFHGYTYAVPRQQAVTLYEQMQRSWKHQDEIDGRSQSEAYRRPQNRTLGPRDMGTATRGVNGPVVAEL